MSHSDPLADMLTRIRNSLMRGRDIVISPNSKIRRNVLDVLQSEGFINRYETYLNELSHPELKIFLKYDGDNSIIQSLDRVSKPGKRVYAGADNIPSFMNGLGVSIISTSKGVMTDSQARQNRVGGEILCRVF